MDADHRFAGWEFASPPSVPSSESVRGRFGYVDGLRGLAIVAVVLYELRHHGIVVASGSLGRLFEEGSRGVDLFFVISGFALALPVLTVLRTEGRAGLDLPRYSSGASFGSSRRPGSRSPRSYSRPRSSRRSTIRRCTRCSAL